MNGKMVVSGSGRVKGTQYFRSAHHALRTLTQQWAEWRTPACQFKSEPISAAVGRDPRLRADPRTTKYKRRYGSPSGVSPRCVGRVSERCASCTREFCRSLDCVSRPRSSRPLRARAWLRGATEGERGVLGELLPNRLWG